MDRLHEHLAQLIWRRHPDAVIRVWGSTTQKGRIHFGVNEYLAVIQTPFPRPVSGPDGMDGYIQDIKLIHYGIMEAMVRLHLINPEDR